MLFYGKSGQSTHFCSIFVNPSEIGTGKSLLARALALEAQVPLFEVRVQDIIVAEVIASASLSTVPIVTTSQVGGSERRLQEAFAKASQRRPCVLLFDDIHTMCASRHSMSSGNRAVCGHEKFMSFDNIITLSIAAGDAVSRGAGCMQ